MIVLAQSKGNVGFLVKFGLIPRSGYAHSPGLLRFAATLGYRFDAVGNPQPGLRPRRVRNRDNPRGVLLFFVTRVRSITKPKPFFNDVKRSAFHFSIDATDVLANDSQRDQLRAADEKYCRED